MGKAARRRQGRRRGPGTQGQGTTAPGQPKQRTPATAGSYPRDLAAAALTRLVRLNAPGRVSLAGAYALGYGGLGLAQQDGSAPDWFNELDPLDTLFLGMVWPSGFRDAYEFGNARTAWLRRTRDTSHWEGIERFVNMVIATSDELELAVDDAELMLLLAGRLENAGLDRKSVV